MNRWAWIVAAIIIIWGLMAGEKVLAARREREFDDLITEASGRLGVPVALIKAVIRTESSFNPEAVNPKDPSAGLMQTTPPTASAMLGRKVAIDELKDPKTSIEAGTRFLAQLISRYTLDEAIQMYNLGETRFRKGARVPDYLAKVKRYFAYYAQEGKTWSYSR